MSNLGKSLQSFTDSGLFINVELSNELVSLLSEQLYQSPLKAIEELVVNAYDAGASVCKVFIPFSEIFTRNVILVYDNGVGMNYEGLVNLWQVGRSNKRTEEIKKRFKRKQIGKFGIGKLASSTIANQLTYISKVDDEILGVSIDFSTFRTNTIGEEKQETLDTSDSNRDDKSKKPIELKVYKIENLNDFIVETGLDGTLSEMGILENIETDESWTLAILENLKKKAKNIKQKNLTWILSTAMPVSVDFRLFLNDVEIESSKSSYQKVVEFNVTDLPEKRLEGLKKTTGEKWVISDGKVISDSFPNGIEGKIFVTERSMYGQKSDDIQRSHGFFVRVRNRLVDLVDPLFGMQPVRYGTLNRFHADIDADDLDKFLTASRDSVEESEIKENFRVFLREVITEADNRYLAWLKEQSISGPKKEGEKELIAPKLVEQPVADALLIQTYDGKGTEADGGWFYIKIDEDIDMSVLIQQLYTSPRSRYTYKYNEQGIDRIVKFDPSESVFWINSAHELVKEYVENDNSRRLLEDFITSEMLLEVYLRESHIDVGLVGEILERRDDLFRSLALDHSFSYSIIAQQLINSSNDEYELEINLVVAARALGFTASQISNADEPDGIAQYLSIPGGLKKITLEAKSSENGIVVTSKIDLSGIRRHADKYNADGVLLIAPDYQGKDNDRSAISKAALLEKISCWTIEQLANVVRAASARNINARDILEIVTTVYRPKDVEQSIDELLNEPSWDNLELYRGIVESLHNLEGSVLDEPRDVSMIVGALATSPNKKFQGINSEDIRKALIELSGVSKGALILDDKDVVFHITTNLDEFERRVSDLTKLSTIGRRKSSFRK